MLHPSKGDSSKIKIYKKKLIHKFVFMTVCAMELDLCLEYNLIIWISQDFDGIEMSIIEY